MKTIIQRLKSLTLVLALALVGSNAYATHAQSADITYQCIGGNQYEIQVSFYRDCAGVAAPNTVTVNIASTSCNQNFDVTLSRIQGTGVDVTQVCNTITTQCNGGNYPGVQEYIYRAVVTLPAQCSDWVFSFSLCCRNNAISTINNPGGENIYVEAKLNNLNFTCNNSPEFSNPPVYYPCVGQTSCFNHGVIEADGDSLYYSLLAPATGPNSFVTYLGGYSATQPLNSNPLVTMNPQNGDICLTPTMLEVTVLAVKVEEWRNGVFVGSVVRDIQLRTVVCNNSLPTVSGINGTGQYSINACAGSNFSFTIPSQDIDAGQTVTLTWNNAISGATFTSNNQQIPTATFSWTPNTGDISQTPYCFTVQVADNNCPLNGVQVYSFCITVSGLNLSTTSTAANCGASNGSASVVATNGTTPYSYQWLPSGGNQPTANGLQAGTYNVTVTDALGCSATQSVVVGSGAANGTINFSSTNVSCFGGNNGSIAANVNGGQQPYTYLWSNGAITPTIQGLVAGTYQLTVTTASGCVSTGSVVISQPSNPLLAALSQTPVSCFGGNNGTATVNVFGGTTPYQYLWNTNPSQTGSTASNLLAGNYQIIVTDNNGCQNIQTIEISEPSDLNVALNFVEHVKCFNTNTGSISVSANGGTSPYQFNWNGWQYTGSTISNLYAGNYSLTVTDNNGCSQTFSQNITQPSQLVSTLSNVQNISCYGLTDGLIQMAVSGGTLPYSYNWSNGATGNTNSNLGVGTYTGWVSDANGCSSVLSSTITQPPIISTTVTPDVMICPGAATTLQAQSVGGTGLLSYIWSNGQGGNSINVSPQTTTIYQVHSVDANGCMGNSVDVEVTVNDINLATLTAYGDDNICEGDMTEIYAVFNPGKGNNYSFNWNNNLGNSLIPAAQYPDSTTTYMITATDECGNTLSDTITVTVNRLPDVQIPAQTGVACGEVQFNFQNNFGNPMGSTYNWNFGDNTFSTNQTPVKSYSQTGVYNVTLIITTPAGCSDLATATINAIVNPKSKSEFEFTPNEELTTNNAKLYFINNSIDASSYSWNFGDGSISNDVAPLHTYIDKGNYTITLIANNSFNCSDTSKQDIIINPEYNFYIPNAFTPDRDGLNEVFSAVGEEIKEFSMQIFNRWGEKIFETHDIQNGWNGKGKDGSNIAQEDVYVYNIRLKDYRGKLHTMQGKVTLIK
ncbi:MAG: gliding motility-associated C-terminal domain-containing protein [Flavobacteriales bacterium]|nr:gliding motility-associated C-terminal domain-containing protein [Flavobacteriales bacterium]